MPSPTDRANPKVLIVGGGLAGLCCARQLNAQGIDSQVLESSDRAGGRVQTDELDGFLLDRGFQVLLTAYPECQQVLDYEALQLCRFEPGALVRYRGKFHRLADPWRQPRYLLTTTFSPLATLADKLRVARLKRQVCQGDLSGLAQRPETTTLARLQACGFSEQFMETFFRPFLGGVFLERDLQTSSRKFDLLFRMFAQGDAVLPARGMGALVDQLVDSLPAGTVRTGARVAKVMEDRVQLTCGEVCHASRVVIATPPGVTRQLVGQSAVGMDAAHGVTCLYFAAERPPLSEPVLVLNGEGKGPIINLSVPSQVAPAYAPPGESLVSVSVLGTVEAEREAGLQRQVVEQLTEWFGSQVNDWRHLKTYRIPYALPSQDPPALSPVEKPIHLPGNLFACGDYLDTGSIQGSIQGAMVSGRRAGQAVATSL
ncbi:MAG: FAD-dependent oxidoreductase [Mariniblastus sp.]|nr:FAD-dependent oxidoreductase [Mariniblastus sp.]